MIGMDVAKAYHIKVEQHPTYIHATGTGALTEENARRFLMDAYQAAVERKCGSLLLEMGFSGRTLHLGGIYSVITERSPDGSRLKRIAYVDVTLKHSPDQAQFATLVAMNRGVNVRLFQSVAEAEQWLKE